MNNLGIKSRVILLGTVPAILFSIILAGYAITKVFTNLNQSLFDRGRIIATQLAPAAEYGVISENTQILQKLVQQALTSELEVRTVMIMDKQGEVLALSGRPLSPDVIQKIKDNNAQQLPWKNGVIFVAAIYRSLVEIDDFPVPNDQKKLLNDKDARLEIGYVYVELSNFGLQALKQDLIIKMFLIGFMGLMFSGLIAWFIGRNITNPIQEIAHAVNKLGEGVFSHTIIENSSGELKVLQKGFNSMSSSLKNAYEHMQDKIHEATVLLRHQAAHDDLTGLINRREFETR